MGERTPEESLRGLTGAGSSKVGTDKAMRARDVSRETAPTRAGEIVRDVARAGEIVRDVARGAQGGYRGESPGSSGSSPDVS
jgi:hypothetical protein